MIVVSLNSCESAPHAPVRGGGARLSEASRQEADEASSDIARFLGATRTLRPVVFSIKVTGPTTAAMRRPSSLTVGDQLELR